MDLFRLGFFSITVVIGCLLVNSRGEKDEMDTSLFDFVAYSVLEDFVDIVEVTAWLTRKVKDNIDKLLEDAFMILIKPQDILKPVINLAEIRNRKDCSDGRLMNVTDVVFREYFNMNLNCPLIGQKMSLFFNEIHNLTARVADIHRRYINSAGNCGPPNYSIPDRTCLQNLVDTCRTETNDIRKFIKILQYDIDSFMDGQQDETFQCLVRGMSVVRNAAVHAVNDIYLCLDNKQNDANKKYNSDFVRSSMGLVGNQFDYVWKKLEAGGKQAKDEEVKFKELKFELPTQPYYEPTQPDPKGLVSSHQPPTKPFGLQQPQSKTAQSQHSEPVNKFQQNIYSDQQNSNPPWRMDPTKRPKYAYEDEIFQEGSFEFDPSAFNELGNEFSDPHKDNTDDHDEL